MFSAAEPKTAVPRIATEITVVDAVGHLVA